jgi:hypothetical protein
MSSLKGYKKLIVSMALLSKDQQSFLRIKVEVRIHLFGDPKVCNQRLLNKVALETAGT